MAGTLQSVGDPSLTFGPIVVDYGPKGCTTHFRVTCTTIGPLIGYYNYIVQFGASGQFHGMGYGNDGITTAMEKRLDVSLPGLPSGFGSIQELFFDQWELLSNETTQTIFANPLIVGSTGWMNSNDKTVLSTMSQYGLNILGAVAQANSDYDTTNNVTTSPFVAPTDARSLQLELEIKKGQVEYENPTYVLRHTSYCSPDQSYDSSIENTETIYSPAELLTEVATGWTYNLPARLYSKIASIPVQVAPTDEATYYSWGWLKRSTRENVLSNFMIEVSTEYQLALWSNLRYALHPGYPYSQ